MAPVSTASVADASGGERERAVSSVDAPLNETRNGDDGDEARDSADEAADDAAVRADGDRERERDADRLDAFEAPPSRMERRGVIGLGECAGKSIAPASSAGATEDDVDANAEDEVDLELSARPDDGTAPSKAAIAGICTWANPKSKP